MATDRQCAANRANAAHSTGPRTPEGKAASKFNRLTHGLDSAAPVVPGESRADWDAHQAGIRASLAPVGPLETELADRAALLFWRLRRVVRYETHAVTATLDHAVGVLAGEFDPTDPVQGTFGPVSPVPAPYSVAGLRDRLADQLTKLDHLCAGAALLRDLPTLPDAHPLPDGTAGRLLDGICDDECLTSLTDIEIAGQLDLPDGAWEDLIGWDGWTAGTVRAALLVVGKVAERTRDQLTDRAAKRLAREITDQRAEAVRLEESLTRAEADFAEAADRTRQMNLLPSTVTDKVTRYEAHLSRQLNQALQLLARFQAARAEGRLRPPAVQEVDFADRTQQRAGPSQEASVPVPPVGPGTSFAERTQTAPAGVPVGAREPASPTGQASRSADRTRSGPVGSPAVEVDWHPAAGRVAVSADRTQWEVLAPLTAGLGGLVGHPEGVAGRRR